MLQRKTNNELNDQIAQKSEDELFVGVLLKSLAKIEEGEAKEALKLEIQNLVFRTRFGPHRLIVSPSRVPSSYGNVYYGNGFYGAPGDYGPQINNVSDEELSVTNRRKATNPKKSTQNDKIKESCSMVTVPRDYSHSDSGEI